MKIRRKNFPFRSILYLMMLVLLLNSCSQKSEWDLVWSEEFDYEGAPASESWAYEMGYIRNGELQYYTDSPDNVLVQEGICSITARLEAADSITSASIHTLGKKEFLYGRIEVSARIPSALGTWPAIWMLGTNIKEIGWPDCGEIDIMEHVGYDPDLIHANIHTKSYNHVIGSNKGNRISVKDPHSEFHLYAMEWYTNRMDFFFNDSLYFTFYNDQAGNPDTWPFNKPHYLLINLAYGGGWGGNQGVDTSRLPLTYEIDYVRYYSRK